MEVNPTYASVGDIFGYKPIFIVPKYQRSYAWDRLEIEDFIKDLESCFRKRKAGTPVNHFFGGVVSVEKSITGTVNQNEYELVDGQQRTATFVLLVSCLISIYKDLLEEARNNGDSENEKIIEKRIDELTKRFIEFEQEINRRTEVVDVLVLSKADEQFFRDLIRQRIVNPQRDSHKKLQYSHQEILAKCRELAGTESLVDKLDNLEIIKQLIDGDFSLIHIKTKDKREAYVLFRVLNDRGKSLTDGDLLRARTLELLEDFPNQQSSVESIWDDILSDSPSTTEEYLRWIYASYNGKRAGANTLFDDFLDHFYPEHNNSTVVSDDAENILRNTQKIQKEIEYCRKLSGGEWPFSRRANLITSWDVNRVSLMLRELRLVVTMPLLLAGCNLPQIKFYEMVQVLERFLFRFKIISNQHITPAINIFYSEAVNIRAHPTTYNVDSLRTRLHELQNPRVNDTRFKDLAGDISYKEGGGNQPLKYFLLTLEYYYRWYNNGAAGEPECIDKTRVYDFSGITIEHIYPKNADSAVINQDLEPVKNSIGNLTFLGPSDNNTGANDDFNTKKPIYQASSAMMNQKIALNANWTIVEFNQREKELKDIAIAIFNI